MICDFLFDGVGFPCLLWLWRSSDANAVTNHRKEKIFYCPVHETKKHSARNDELSYGVG